MITPPVKFLPPLWLLWPVLACGPSQLEGFVQPELARCDNQQTTPANFTIVTYNIRSGLSSSLETITQVLEKMEPDIIALQEVDRDVGRSGHVDQAQQLAEHFSMHYAFLPAHPQDGGDYGIALLSSFPFADVTAVALDPSWSWSPRVALDAWLCVGPHPLRVLAAHADVVPLASDQQCQNLARLARSSVGWGVVVTGDLNAFPNDTGPRALASTGLSDIVADHAEGPTFQGDPWLRRLDYIFVDSPLASGVKAVDIVDTQASDHRPVMARIDPRGLDDL